MPELIIEERHSEINPNVTVLDLSGKVTLGEGSVALRNKIIQLLDEDKKKILLNFQNEELTYTDSSGIGEFVSAFNRVNKVGGTLKLLNLSQYITTLFTTVKLIKVFDTFDEEEEALKSFK
mgnify:CR=1 FL=1